MTHWTLARLELARTPVFPEGSPSHAYILRVPLTEDGLIDEKARAADPSLATVQRLSPGAPSQSGYLLRKENGWAFSYELGDDDDESVYHLDAHPLRLGEYLTLTEPDGSRLPFKVVHLEEDDTATVGAHSKSDP